MFGVKQKSYGKRYLSSKVRVKLNKKRLLFIIIVLLVFCEVALGILWALGF